MMIEAIGTACTIGFEDDMNESIMMNTTISDDTFRMALDKALKRKNLKKKERDKIICEYLISTPLDERDMLIDIVEKEAVEYSQNKLNAKTCRSENAEQMDVVTWWRHTYEPLDYIIHCTWNGASRTPRERAEQKLLGVHPGVSDLAVERAGLWIEMKRVDPKLCKWSDEQKKWKEHVESFGETYILAYGFEDAKRQLIPFMERKLMNVGCDESLLLSK